MTYSTVPAGPNSWRGSNILYLCQMNTLSMSGVASYAATVRGMDDIVMTSIRILLSSITVQTMREAHGPDVLIVRKAFLLSLLDRTRYNSTDRADPLLVYNSNSATRNIISSIDTATILFLLEYALKWTVGTSRDLVTGEFDSQTIITTQQLLIGYFSGISGKMTIPQLECGPVRRAARASCVLMLTSGQHCRPSRPIQDGKKAASSGI